MKQLFLSFLLFLIFFTSCNEGDKDGPNTDSTNPPPPTLLFSIINVHPHDTASFTQGLVAHNGQLYESTGQPKTSWLGPLDIKTGKIDRKIVLDNEYFGEGITILDGKIYHLTWQNNKGFVYDLDTYNKLKEFTYVTEGWGITNDGTNLIMSDGTSNLFYFQPDSIKLIKTVGVTDNYGPVPNLNELEYIDGFIYANQWQTPYILKIDPSTGSVVGRLDLKKVEQEIAGKIPGADFSVNSSNGIAYDSSNNKIYITGKNWPSLYEIRLQ